MNPIDVIQLARRHGGEQKISRGGTRRSYTFKNHMSFYMFVDDLEDHSTEFGLYALDHANKIVHIEF